MRNMRALHPQNSNESVQSRGRGSPEPISRPEFQKLSYGKLLNIPRTGSTESLLSWMGPHTPIVAQDAIRRLINFREGDRVFKVDLPPMRTRLPMFNHEPVRSQSADFALHRRLHETDRPSDYARFGAFGRADSASGAPTTLERYHAV